jgi:hypothetical protein
LKNKYGTLGVYVFFFLLISILVLPAKAQPGMNGEEDLYAETKQVNQFFRRFNCEESLTGERFYPGDPLYQNPELRLGFLNVIFDHENPYLDTNLKEKFISEVMNPEAPIFLDFHGGEWFAEVSTLFTYKGNTEPVTLYLKLQEESVGSKWVFTQAHAPIFNELMEFEPSVTDSFLHPLSHELDFMNLAKLFRSEKKLGGFVASDYSPDHLTLFLSEFQKGNLKFKAVTGVNFHFFQVENWYFQLTSFTRKGMNRGWLISQLSEIPDGQKETFQKYIYHQ